MTTQCRLMIGNRPMLALVVAVAAMTGPVAAQSVVVRGTDSAWIAYPKALSKEWQPDNVGRTKPGIDWAQLAQINRLPGAALDYRLGAGDTIEVEIIGLDPPLEREIQSSGSITLPILGDIKVADLTAEEAEEAIAAALTREKLMNEPQVLVSVTGFEAQKVEIIGEVDRPGEYAITSRVTLMDLIFFAGGIDFNAARYGYLHRRGADHGWSPVWPKVEFDQLVSKPDVGGPGSDITRVDLEPLKRGGVLERNFLLRDGDRFYIPFRQTEFVYVMGEVSGGGAFELPSARRLTVTQAVSAAGGLTRASAPNKTVIVREEPSGNRHDLRIDLAKIIGGKQPDVELLPNDIVFVPTNGAKKFGLNLLSTIPNYMVYLLVY